MARHLKTGLAYYNLETDRYSDMKLKRLIRAFSCNGMAVYDFILNEVYRDKGFYMVWDEDACFNVADVLMIKETMVKDVVLTCCKVDLFNVGLFESRGVITSQSIQERYVHICKLCKRTNIFIPEELRLIPELFAKPPEETGKTPDEVHKESKEKKVKKESEGRRTNGETKIYGDEVQYTIEHCAVVALADDRWVRANKVSEKDLFEFNAVLEKQGVYEKNPLDYKQHFANWKKMNANETNKRIFTGSSGAKSAGAEQLLSNLRADIETSGA